MKNYIKLTIVMLAVTTMLFAADGKKYGKTIDLKEKTKISEVLSKPEKYMGKKVLVEGTVVNVCEKRGCWIELSSDKKYETIKVKVNDGEIVFPMESKGKTALVEGELYSIESKETKEHKENCTEDKTNCSDDKSKSECSDHKPGTTYLLKGIGAVIK